MLFGAVIFGAVCVAGTASADNRIFTYTYEPETEPRGDWEYEQSVTLRTGRSAAVGQQDYQRWQFREEIEHGVTDRYTVSLYLNHEYEHFNDPATGAMTSQHEWRGASVENRYLVLDPVDHAVGLTLYLEPTYDGNNDELEQKIIIGQRHGDWKWAVNLTHATEWPENFRNREGKLELSAGLARQLTSRWSPAWKSATAMNCQNMTSGKTPPSLPGRSSAIVGWAGGRRSRRCRRFTAQILPAIPAAVISLNSKATSA